MSDDADAPAEAQINNIWVDNKPALDNADDTAEQWRVIEEVLDEFAAVIAESGEDKSAASLADAHINSACDKAGVARSMAKDVLEERVEEYKAEIIEEEADYDIPACFDDLLQKCLDKVVPHRTTDHHSDTTYQWHFSDGKGTVISTNDHHWDWTEFYSRYSDESGYFPQNPSETLREAQDWREFLAPIMNERLVDKDPSTGPRTRAVHSLMDAVEKAVAYKHLDDAVERGGVWVNDEPPAHDEVWLPASKVIDATTQQEISERALQEELKARDHTLDEHSGVAVSERRNGSSQRFWKLDASDFPTPAEYVEDPETLEQRLRNARNGNAGQQRDGTETADGDDDGEPGKMGEYGPGTDDGDDSSVEGDLPDLDDSDDEGGDSE